MSDTNRIRCQCPSCQGSDASSTQQLHTLMKSLLSALDEQQQRLYAGLEATKRGKGSESLIARITGLSEAAIVLGQEELEQLAFDTPSATASLTNNNDAEWQYHSELPPGLSFHKTPASYINNLQQYKK